MQQQNGLVGGTAILTTEGVKELKRFAGKEVSLLVHDGTWVKAQVHSCGEQDLVRMHLRRASERKEILCSSNHKWLTDMEVFSFGKDVVLSGTSRTVRETTALKIAKGARLLSVFPGEGLTGAHWEVVRTAPTGLREEVFSAQVDGFGAFALDGFILTGNS